MNPRSHTESVATHEVSIPVGKVVLGGTLTLPESARGVVLFAHGSGSSRYSPRNAFVARGIQEAGVGTLLFDLLTEPEAQDRSNVFDILLLADRLAGATRWLRSEMPRVSVGYFGASTGAAAALRAAAATDEPVAAIVSRGGRPDLAMDVLAQITVPTLLIVGERDVDVLQLNRRAYERLGGEKELRVVPGATHLFEEEGALEQVVRHAQEWFGRYLGGA